MRDAEAISHHYDVGNDFYRLVLGPSLTYSCAYWADESFDLADAQTAKYELISRKLDLQPGMRLLDVGCGWGGMVLHAAQHHGVRAVGITLSHEQATLARERVMEAGLEDRIEIRVQDYRDISDGPFDAISSIGMFEHVGLARAEEYFQDLYDLLAPGARLLNHAISRPDPTRAAIAPRSFMARYVFPDAELLEVGTAVTAMQKHHLEVRDVEEGKKIGSATSIARSPALGGTIGLAYVRTNHAVPGARVKVAAGDGELGAVIVKLPFDR